MKLSSEKRPALAAVRIREYQPGDFPYLCQLDATCFPPTIAYDPEEIAAALLQPRTLCLVADNGQDVVGFILVHYRRDVGHIITIDLHPNHRRRGLGTRFMDLAEKALLHQGMRRVVLEVATDNDPALAFYRGRGFSIRRLLAGYYRDGTDAYLMEKPL